MIIKILGTGCPKCKLLEQSIRNVVENNQIDDEKELLSLLITNK